MENLFKIAVDAKLPFIGCHTDDLVNVRSVITALTKKKLQPLPTSKAQHVGDSYIWYTQDMSAVNTEMYHSLCESGAVAVVINPPKDGDTQHLIFDAGQLPTPREFHASYLQHFVSADKIDAITNVLQGLSLKSAQEICQITMAHTKSLIPKDIRMTRMMLGGSIPGLAVLDTDIDFYVMPQVLRDWVKLNDKYFLSTTIPFKLVPRGLLLDGPPGVGKSMAARALAKHWEVPLFRLDIATALNRYQGESESRLAANLQKIDENSPCIHLIDEGEKLFGNLEGGEGTPGRMLSQILWWLQSHTSRVITVITTNNRQALPKELYRPGRIDRVIDIPKLTLMEAKNFAIGVYENILCKLPTSRRKKVMFDVLDEKHEGAISHAEVTETVYELIKGRMWMLAEDEDKSDKTNKIKQMPSQAAVAEAI